VLIQIVPIPWQTLVWLIIIWVIIGLLAGLLTGLVFRLLLRNRKQLIASTVLGIAGAIIGMYISGWASLRTYNAGSHRDFLRDSDKRLIEWRTFLAENRFLVVVICAVVLVALWHIALEIIKRVQRLQKRP
jgi:uncharacterized membrane protein YeaQ/YmgE (transglycosylase-associated protein family)